MIQEGWVALIRASKNFDEAQGVRYSTFAYCWVESRISNTLKKDAQTKIAEYGYGENMKFESIEKKAHLLKELEELSERDRKILNLYAGGHTQDEIANKLDLTHGRISQIISDIKKNQINKKAVS